MDNKILTYLKEPALSRGYASAVLVSALVAQGAWHLYLFRRTASEYDKMQSRAKERLQILNEFVEILVEDASPESIMKVSEAIDYWAIVMDQQ